MEQIMKGMHFILMYSCMLTFQFFLQYAFKHLEQVFILPFFATAVSTEFNDVSICCSSTTHLIVSSINKLL